MKKKYIIAAMATSVALNMNAQSVKVTGNVVDSNNEPVIGAYMYTGASRWVTGEAARMHVQKQRLKYTGIMAGVGTVLAAVSYTHLRRSCKGGKSKLGNSKKSNPSKPDPENRLRRISETCPGIPGFCTVYQRSLRRVPHFI